MILIDTDSNFNRFTKIRKAKEETNPKTTLET
jgi:hypothetical protein